MNTIKTQLKPQRWRRILDLGGGHGLYAIAFTGLNSKLEAVVFDLPKIVQVTRKYVDAYNAERIHIIPGDFYKDDIGRDYDAVFSSFNQSCSDPVLIPKLVQALKPGGDLILRRFKDSSRDGALKVLDWNLVHFEGKKIGSKPHSSGKVMSREGYIEQLKAAGFTGINVVSVDEISEIIFARKPSGNGSEKR
jgi:protein-L-isoaspartate O-methyltransferase